MVHALHPSVILFANELILFEQMHGPSSRLQTISERKTGLCPINTLAWELVM
jgi:hypothetical protein